MKLMFVITLAISSQGSASAALLTDPSESYLLGWTVWSGWSECSQSCGGGHQSRVRTCEGGDTCQEKDLDIEKLECNEWECFEGVWGDWSPCEDGWHFRERCDESFECEFEEGECGMEDLGTQEWSEWGVCDQELGRRTRERCTSEYGCELDQQECEIEIDQGEIGEESWGAWGPCVQDEDKDLV